MTKQITCIPALFCLLFACGFNRLYAQSLNMGSPNKNINVHLVSPKSPGEVWSFAVDYKNDTHVLPAIKLGLLREDADFAHNLNLKGIGKVQVIHDRYVALHGKKSICTNDANEVSLQFITADKKEIDVILRVYNDGVAFRYTFPEKKTGQYKMLDELTAYKLPDSAKRWIVALKRLFPDRHSA